MDPGNIIIETETISASAGELIEKLKALSELMDARLDIQTEYIDAKQRYDQLTEQERSEVGSYYLDILRAASQDAIYELSLSEDEFVFDGNEKMPAVTVTSGPIELEEGDDYCVRYSNNVHAGTARVRVVFRGIYSGSITSEFQIERADINDCDLKMDDTFYYTGKPITPVVTLKTESGLKLRDGFDYTVEYFNNTNIGDASVVIRGIGDYEGELNESYEIVKAAEQIIDDETYRSFKGMVRSSGVLKYQVLSDTVTSRTVTVKSASRKGLKKVTIPQTVTFSGRKFQVVSISNKAFKGQKKLKTITVKSTTLRKCGRNAFKKINKKAVIKVPKKKLKAYKKLFSKKGQNKTVKIVSM